MRKIIAFIISVFMIISVFCACTDSENFSKNDNLINKYKRSTDSAKTFNYNDKVTDAPSSYTTYSSEITDFALRMFRNYHKNAGKDSYVFSPASTALQLGLMANGASEETRDEIINALGRDLSLENINQCSSYFRSRIEAVGANQADKKDSLSGDDTSNGNQGFVKFDTAMFANDTADIKTKFMQTDVDYYGCDFFRLMFNDSNALNKVNNRFKKYGSENFISSLDEDQNLISVTAADICDIWLNAYAETDIEQGTFKSSGTDKSVTYMTSNETYMKTDKAQAVVKYTSKTPLKFMAVIPNEDITLSDYISDFTNLEFSNLFESIDFSKVAAAKIPEFTISAQNNAENITSIAEDSGLYTLFTDRAEFSELTRTDNFSFNAMYEITPKISVNACGIGGHESNGDEPALSKHTQQTVKADVTLEFNRPFIFLILDNESNIPVYIGTVDF